MRSILWSKHLPICLSISPKGMEVWKQSHCDNYEVSNLGNVRHKKTKNLRKLSLINGYSSIMLNGKNHRVHRLVAKAFLENSENRPQVNHKHLPKTDNRLENLEWVTASENMMSYWHKEDGKTVAQPLKFESDTEVIVCPSMRQASFHFEKCLGTIWSAIKSTDVKENYKWRGYKITRLTSEQFQELSEPDVATA